ncbi:MAG TPA: hypothetical protein VK797_28110 [Tepidisphaeraceae bacterium]|nr:hypothetical protein [Tepidisphaeraceae bacterium]
MRFWLLPASAGQAFAEHARFLKHSQGDSRVAAGNRLCHDVSGHVGRFEQPGTSRLAKFLLPGLVRRGELRIGSDPSPQRRAPDPRRLRGVVYVFPSASADSANCCGVESPASKVLSSVPESPEVVASSWPDTT